MDQRQKARHGGVCIFQNKKLRRWENQKRLNLLPDHDMLLLEGHTRPAMKQAKSISAGEEIYSCSLLLSKETGKIIAACAAGKRGFCKRIAALAYKLVKVKMHCRSQSAARMYAKSGGYRRIKLNKTQKKKQ